jgi:hypothetical protein
MFALPQMISVPVFGFGVGGIEWPWLGPALASVLLTALIGGFLGLLRASAGPRASLEARGFKEVVGRAAFGLVAGCTATMRKAGIDRGIHETR